MTQHKNPAFGATAIIISLLWPSRRRISCLLKPVKHAAISSARFLDEPNPSFKTNRAWLPSTRREESEEPVEIQNLDSSSIDAEPLIEDEDQLDVIETPTTDVLDDTAPASVEVNRAPFGNVIEREPYDVYK